MIALVDLCKRMQALRRCDRGLRYSTQARLNNAIPTTIKQQRQYHQVERRGLVGLGDRSIQK